MTTEISTIDSAQSPYPLSERTAPHDDHAIQFPTVAHIYWGHAPEELGAKAVLKAVMDELVALVEDNPSVWALHATQDSSVIRVCDLPPENWTSCNESSPGI